MTQVEVEYEKTIRSAVNEAAAQVAFSWQGNPEHGRAIYVNSKCITDAVIGHLQMHFKHTRKAKTQRSVRC